VASSPTTKLPNSTQRKPVRPATTDQLIEWFWRRIPKRSLEEFSRSDWMVCQCGTEELIASCGGRANRMRTFLLVSVFIDQMIYTHFHRIYPAFRERFKIPKLVSHGHGGAAMASSSWLVYSGHGYDKLIDWEEALPIAKTLFAECLEFLQNEIEAEYAISHFMKLAAIELSDEFEVQPEQFLREIIAEAVEEINRPASLNLNNDGEQLPLNF
jgi:hypothetical protein